MFSPADSNVIIEGRARLHPFGWLFVIGMIAIFVGFISFAILEAVNATSDDERSRAIAGGIAGGVIGLFLVCVALALAAWGLGGRYIFEVRSAATGSPDVFFLRTCFGVQLAPPQRVGPSDSIEAEFVAGPAGSGSLFYSAGKRQGTIVYTFLGRRTAERMASVLNSLKDATSGPAKPRS